MTAFRPADAQAVQETVAWAVAQNQSLEIVGGGSKRALGRPSRTDHTLELGALGSIVDYEAAELVLTAQAATPLKAIEAELAAQSQMLAFEPPDWRVLLGGGGEPTLGGAVACNLGGPRRVRAGAARDHFLGFSAVNGWGEAWKAGGRVVKNVTGYDMCKLQAGAYGTLSVLTELSVKVLPRPETSCSLVLPSLTDEAAIVALTAALNTPHEVSGAAHLPPACAARSSVAAIAGSGQAATVLRLEGPRPSVDFRAGALQAALGPAERLSAPHSEALWREIGAVGALLEDGTLVWRLCPTPSAAPALVRRIAAALPASQGFFEWGGGLVWLSVDAAEAGPDGGAAAIRAALAQVGGHATLIRAPEALRQAVPVFEPVAPALGALARRVKAGFDPQTLLNPGRMLEGA